MFAAQPASSKKSRRIPLAVALLVCKKSPARNSLAGAMMDRDASYVLVFLLLTVQSSHAVSPVVTNVVASQRAARKLVDIQYDAFDSDSAHLIVRIEISANAGRTFDVPAISLSGDVGANVSPGPNKAIVWDAGTDWDGEYSPEMRVKVIASDKQGFPEMEWGSEVPSGGFLMGQDGGPEGAGPSRHVNIAWSFWLSKYEITVGQYVEYLNMAIAAGEVYRDATKVYAREGSYVGVPGGSILIVLGTDVQWSISRFVVISLTNLPVQLNWHGAMAFARHYGYDLPTEAEWEKGARGTEYDGAGEHRIYPWGNVITGSEANFFNSGDPFRNERTPVGFFSGSQLPAGQDTANPYGLYDLVGNMAEWTRSVAGALESYPQLESLRDQDLESTDGRITRGGSYLDTQSSSKLKCYGRADTDKTLFNGYGFRVVRRSGAP
jgi:formylglycine-generating enzyme required for sulfatase activity